MSDNLYFTFAEVTVLAGIAGSTLLGILMCILKSRCTSISTPCISCDRNVISEDKLDKVTITKPTPPV